MGLFDEMLGSPAARQELILRKALEMRRQRWPHSGFYYRGAGDLLLKHGKFYSGRELPEQYKHLTGPMQGCFMNAMLAAEANPSLRYCEGVYTTGGGHYTSHAWCLDPAGELLELTYPTEPERIAHGLDFHTKQPVLSPERWGYWGAVFHPEYARAVEDAYEGHAILDRPVHDELFDGGAGLEAHEGRTEWPVFRYPYDPDRREL